MDTRHSVYRFLAKILVFCMLIQGLPLAHLSQTYQWEFQPERLVELLTQLSTLTLEDAHAGTMPEALTDPAKSWIPGWRTTD